MSACKSAQRREGGREGAGAFINLPQDRRTDSDKRNGSLVLVIAPSRRRRSSLGR